MAAFEIPTPDEFSRLTSVCMFDENGNTIDCKGIVEDATGNIQPALCAGRATCRFANWFATTENTSELPVQQLPGDVQL